MPSSTTHLVVATVVPIAVLALALASERVGNEPPQTAPAEQALTIQHDESAGTITVFRDGRGQPILTQNARPDRRPYLHPIVAPDGRGVITEESPAHHPHQTGLYWGFTRLNGRDYFHNPQGDHWRRVSATVTRGDGTRGEDEVRWQTVYDLLDAAGQPVLTETQRWSMRERDGRFILDLEWRGEARADVTIGQHEYGGLFLRMPWRQGTAGEVVNAARQRNDRAEGQRAMWIDVGMRVDGRSDLAHVAIFDHPDNTGYPQAWRVDGELGVGSARSRAGDFTLARGSTEILRHQLVVYSGTLSDVALTDAWTAFSGSRSQYATSALWGIAQREGREAPLLTADEAVAAMTLMPGFDVKAWAAEPMITQPMAFAWDDRGRLWVAENRDYETRGRGFSNAGTSRIVILEDTDRDGVADSRKVFMDGIVFPSALAIGFDGVFVGAPPNLLFVPDRDRDDNADVDAIEVRLTGWGIQDRHEVLNSLHWGPDGWLYGLQGYATASKVRRPEVAGRLFKAREPFPSDLLEGEGIEINGGVWRYHPTKDRFEVVAHGFSNPWGVDYDAKGQLLISACVIPHLWHVVPGGIYQRQGGRHFNPYVYSDIQTIADHRHRSAHGGARVYQSDAFPDSHRGRIFMANIHEHAVLSDVLERKGSGFTARHGDDFLLANNAHWIGFSVEIGPDGAIYVLDWHDADICGNDVHHGETGRIFRIAPARSLAESWDGRYGDLGALADAALVDLQTSPSDWHARRARIILQGRAAASRLAAGTHAALLRMFQTHASADVRLRAMWSLHVTGGWTPGALVGLLGDRDEHVRAWAVQLLTEDRSAPAEAVRQFMRMARDDRSPVVRLYLASALQRLDDEPRWTLAAELMARTEDAGDPNVPTMVWLGVEPLVPRDPARALDYASRSGIPQVARFIARRSVDAGALEVLVAALGRGPRTISLLEGMRDGLTGRYDLTAPASWPATLARLRRSDAAVAALAGDVARQFGDTETAQRNLAAVRDAERPLEDRRRAVQVLAAQRRPQLAGELATLFGESLLRTDVIRAIAAFDNDGLGQLLIARYETLSTAEKREAVQTLASRARYGRLLTDAIATGLVPRRDVPSHVARQLRRVVGVRFAEVWGSVESNTVEEKAIARYRSLLVDSALADANLSNGEATFQQTCGACHKLYGQGGEVGPDLTGSNWGSLEYLLFNVLDPNGDVPEAYRMTVVTTRDGRMFSGNVVAETDRQLTLRTVAQDRVVLNTADIQSRDTTTASLMPPGLLDGLTDREVIDLVGYLRTVDPRSGP